MHDISVIIVNYRAAGLVKNCLRSIMQDLTNSGLDVHLVVVNSGPDDLATAMLTKEFPAVQLIQKDNQGYSSAVNTGLRAAAAAYYFILNPDTMLLQGNVISHLHDFMQQNQRVGMVVPKLLNPDGSVQHSSRRFPNFFIPLFSRTVLGRLAFAKRTMRSFLMTDWDHQGTRDVDWALGSALFVRAVAVTEVGEMDERGYFMYVEDTDWCRSFWQRGWRVTYVGDISVVHYHARSSAETAGLFGIINPLARQHIRSWVHYFRKFHGQPDPHVLYNQKNNAQRT